MIVSRELLVLILSWLIALNELWRCNDALSCLHSQKCCLPLNLLSFRACSPPPSSATTGELCVPFRHKTAASVRGISPWVHTRSCLVVQLRQSLSSECVTRPTVLSSVCSQAAVKLEPNHRSSCKFELATQKSTLFSTPTRSIHATKRYVGYDSFLSSEAFAHFSREKKELVKLCQPEL